MDRGRRDQPAIAGGLGIGLVEIDRVILADRFAVELNGFPGQRVGNGLARLAGNDVVPDLAQIGVFPEIGLKGLGLGHPALPYFPPFVSAALRNSLYSIINFPDPKIKPAGNPDAQAQTARYRESGRDRHPYPCGRTLRHAWRRWL